MSPKFTAYRALVAVVSLLVPAGCNGDLFVKDYLPDPPVIEVATAGSSLRIPFVTGDWEVAGMNGVWVDDNGHEAYFTLEGMLYDLEGNRIAGSQFSGRELIELRYDDGLTDFRLRRAAPELFEADFGENLDDRLFGVEISLTDGIQNRCVTLHLHPTGKMQAERMELDLTQFKYWDSTCDMVDVLEVNNKGKDSVTFVVYPFRKAHRLVEFWSDNIHDDAERLFAEPPLVTIPDTNDGKPVEPGRQVSFRVGEQQLPYLGPEVERRVTIAPGAHRRIEMWVIYYEYWVPYTLHAVSPLGRRRMLTGRLTSRDPYDYFILNVDPDKTPAEN